MLVDAPSQTKAKLLNVVNVKEFFIHILIIL